MNSRYNRQFALQRAARAATSDTVAWDPSWFGDADDSTIIEISDAVLLISYIFVPGSAPPCDPDNYGEPDC